MARSQAPVLFDSAFLPGLGLAVVAGLTVLGHRYWFATAFRCIAIALAQYGAALIAIAS